jgi:hypothetical protein
LVNVMNSGLGPIFQRCKYFCECLRFYSLLSEPFFLCLLFLWASPPASRTAGFRSVTRSSVLGKSVQYLGSSNVERERNTHWAGWRQRAKPAGEQPVVRQLSAWRPGWPIRQIQLSVSWRVGASAHDSCRPTAEAGLRRWAKWRASATRTRRDVLRRTAGCGQAGQPPSPRVDLANPAAEVFFFWKAGSANPADPT